MTKTSRRLAAGCVPILWLLLAGCGTGDEPADPSAETPEGSQEALASEDDKTLYALGMAIAGNLRPFDVDERELALIQRGMADAVFERDPQVSLQEYGPKIQALANARTAKAASGEAAAASQFLEKAAAEPDAVRTESGLIITELTAGTGVSPKATDRVKVHYHGTLRDGRVFDSSVDRGQPATFSLNQVVRCWTEGLQRMRVGGKSRLVCPAELAYGQQGRPPQIPPGAALAFEVELLEIL